LDKISDSKYNVVWKTHPKWLNDELFDDCGDMKMEMSDMSDYTIGLLRRDLVDTALSFAIAEIADEFLPPYRTTQSYLTHEKIEFAVKVILGHNANMLSSAFVKCDEIIYYEDFANTPSAIYSDLKMLNKPESVHCRMKNFKSIGKENIILNYDDAHSHALKLLSFVQMENLVVKNGIMQADTSFILK